MRPRSFHVFFVVSGIVIICYMIRRFWGKTALDKYEHHCGFHPRVSRNPSGMETPMQPTNCSHYNSKQQNTWSSSHFGQLPRQIILTGSNSYLVFPKDCHLSTWCLLELSAGLSATFSNGCPSVWDLVCNIFPWYLASRLSLSTSLRSDAGDLWARLAERRRPPLCVYVYVCVYIYIYIYHVYNI